MAETVRTFHCRPESVFRVLSDGWLYPVWVVGAARMRTVEPNWPQPGTKLHHSVGLWPLLFNDVTAVVEWDPPRRIILTARGWPIGEAEVVIEAKPRGEQCVVRMRETASRGPASWIPQAITDWIIGPRNAETLHRLAYIAEAIDPANFHTTAASEDAHIGSGADSPDPSRQ